MSSDYDILIAGGGLVGASLACALSGQGLRIAIIESQPFGSQSQPSYDDRSLALAYGTGRIFAGMGLWEALHDEVCPIHRIRISDRGHFGATRLDCAEEGVEALGYVAETRVLGAVFTQRLAQLFDVELLCPATVEDVRIDTERAFVDVDMQGGKRALAGRVLVAADGSGSLVRERLDIATTRWNYGQTAVIANITPGRHHDHVAFERFTDSGPLAVLPLHDGRCSVVLTLLDDQVDAVMAQNDAQFLAGLQERFGRRLGTLQRVGARHAYPLSLVRARDHVLPRVAVIGNAAHTLHPIAGQGFNLGLRDVAALADVIADATAEGADPGSMQVLNRYADWRKRDHRRVIAFTDGLARLFANPLAPVVAARDLGLIALELVPGFRHLLTRQTMGLAGRLPRLARGLPLRGAARTGGGIA